MDIKDDHFVTLLLDNGETREDLKLPDDMFDEVTRIFENSEKEVLITVLKACQEEKIIAHKQVDAK